MAGRQDNLRPFKPGHSGNPGGRPRGSGSLTATMARLLDQPTQDKLVKAVLGQAARGNGTAMKLVWDRIDGALTRDGEPQLATHMQLAEFAARHTVAWITGAYEESGEPMPPAIAELVRALSDRAAMERAFSKEGSSTEGTSQHQDAGDQEGSPDHA